MNSRGSLRLLSVIVVLLAVVTSAWALAAPVSAAPPLGTWSTPVKISDEGMFRGDLWGSYVYVYGSGVTSLKVSDDYGATWNPELPFTGRLDASDGTLYRVNWSGAPEFTSLFTESDDHGTTWSDPVDIGMGGAFRIAKFGSTLLVYGYEGDGTSDGFIQTTRSTDGGATWSTPVVVDSPVHCEDPLASDMVYLGGSIYMTYYDYGDDYSHVVVMESTDMGASWGDRRVVGDGHSPMISADAGALYVTYWAWNGVDTETGLNFTKSTDGDTWTTPIKVGDFIKSTDAQTLHALTAVGGTVFAAYITYDNPGGLNEYWVHINYSADGGSTWEDLGDVTGGVGAEIIPNVMFDGAMLHFTWFESQGVSGTYYRSLTLDEPIPEFAGLLAPAIGLAVVVLAVVRARRRP